MTRKIKSLDEGQLDLMWDFLKFGSSKSNIPQLKEHCDMLRTAMLQKTGGQENYAKAGDVDIANDLGTIINCIVIETMMLYLSGDLDALERMKADAEHS